MATIMSQFSYKMKWGGVKSILTLLLGIFLLVAAALKIHGLITDPDGQENFLALPWLQVLTIELEILLGLGLLFFPSPHTEGTRVSGPLSPGGRGVRGEGESRATPLRSLFQILFTTSVLLGLLALGFTLFTKDPWATLARLRGETLAVLPPVTSLGEGTAGEQRTFQIQLHNYSDKPIKVVGGTTTCSCIATQDLPITIPAGGTESINVKIKFSGSPGRFAHRFVLYSDSDERLTVARFSGSVTLRSPVAGEKSRVTQALPSPLAGERPGVSQALPSPLAGEESGVRGE